ncbi:MAG TPA: cupredoxin domain-containing protein [Burkholderiales bacterium]|nr:cupredoxin domain-containing protein [Burkholderiales bacterium]
MGQRMLMAALSLGGMALSISTPVFGEGVHVIVIKDHRFNPAELQVPSRQKIRLVVENQDPTAEEFESYSLNREKVIPGNAKAVIFVGPLEPGTYEFFGEFHEATAKGRIIAQ